jgi:transposase-like protein
MKTRLSKPARSKARNTEEYKKEALELWRASGRSAAKIAAELGIRAPLIYRWARPKRQANLSGNESKSGRSVEELEAEIRRLRAENAKFMEQREARHRLGHGSTSRHLFGQRRLAHGYQPTSLLSKPCCPLRSRSPVRQRRLPATARANTA